MGKSDEIWNLANHHFGILKHRFPNYDCTLDELQPYWVCVHRDAPFGKIMIFMAAFSFSCVQITTPPFKQDVQDQFGVLTIEYADPEFTDDTLSDILRELESIAQRKGWPNVKEDPSHMWRRSKEGVKR